MNNKFEIGRTTTNPATNSKQTTLRRHQGLKDIYPLPAYRDSTRHPIPVAVEDPRIALIEMYRKPSFFSLNWRGSTWGGVTRASKTAALIAIVPCDAQSYTAVNPT